MTPSELKTARRQLGLSAQAFARLIGVHDGRTVRRWEAGDAPIPGLLPVYLATRSVLESTLDAAKAYMTEGDYLAAKKMLELPKSGRLGLDA